MVFLFGGKSDDPVALFLKDFGSFDGNKAGCPGE
jgi:hypothetical protein